MFARPLVLCLILAGCGPGSVLSALGTVGNLIEPDSGIGVDVGVQTGGTATRGLRAGGNDSIQRTRTGDNSVVTQTSDENKVRTESVETVIVNEGVSAFEAGLIALIALLVGWFLPSDREIGGWFRRRRNA